MKRVHEASGQLFIKFLKDRKAYDTFVRALSMRVRDKTLNEYLDICMPAQFVSGAFSWDSQSYNGLPQILSTSKWAKLSHDWRRLLEKQFYKIPDDH